MNVPDEIASAATRDTLDVQKVRSWLYEEYLKQIPQRERFTNPEGSIEFLSWLNDNMSKGNSLDFLFSRDNGLGKNIYNSFSDKLTWIKQRKCRICDGDGKSEDLFPVWIIPIKITPTTWQSSRSKQKRVFRDAVKTYFAGKSVDGLQRTGRYCVALTFVLNRSSRDKDCDNMAKGLMDSFCAAIGIDDGDVQHLDIVKLIFPDCEDYVTLRIAPSRLNNHGDVLVQVTKSIFVVGDRIG